MRFEKNSVDVAFEVIHGDQRLAQRLRQHFAVRDADQQRAHQPRTARHRDRVQILQRDSGLLQRFAHHRNDLTQVFARGQLRHHAAIFPVNRDLRCDDAGENRIAARDYGSGSLVARRLNPQNNFALLGQENASNFARRARVRNEYGSIAMRAAFPRATLARKRPAYAALAP